MEPHRKIISRCLAEFLGVFGIIIFSPGAAIVDKISGGQLGLLGIAISTGFLIMVMIYAVGHISGAHFNPAVTIGFAIAKKFRPAMVPFYIGSQVAGGVAGALLLRVLYGPIVDVGVTIPSGSLMQGFLAEVVATYFLMFVIISVATDSRAVGQMAGLAIGSTVAMLILCMGPISSASMNPARSFGPALVTGILDVQWLYWVAPIIGSCLGALAYEFVKCYREDHRIVEGS